MLEVVFGPRHNTNGIVPIRERGPGICAVVSILKECSAADPADARIELDSLFLQGMLSDTRAPTSGGTAVTTGPIYMEVGDCEPTDEEWENM